MNLWVWDQSFLLVKYCIFVEDIQKDVMRVLSILFILCVVTFMGCTKTVYTTQTGQNWSEYKSVKNGDGKIVNKTKKPKTKNIRKQNW